jgi:flagellar assembly protein FliH
MALIKNVKSDRILKEAVVLDMGDLARQAERLLSSARAEASRIAQQAKVEAERLTTEAAQRGFDDGLVRGLEEGRAKGATDGRDQANSEMTLQLQQLASQWQAALTQWRGDRSAMLHDARDDVVRFAFALGKKVVHRLIQCDPTIARDQVGQALAVLSRPRAVEIKINPQDRPLIDQAFPELLASIEGCQHANVSEDSSITRGGCLVKTAGGEVDATIETQLERIAEALVPQSAMPNAESKQSDQS